ncbi:MAG: SAM-dependent methyltransferase [Nitratireductor sp.]|nr:SAM-dependent methyltransferase [Nitratireductor sp.]
MARFSSLAEKLRFQIGRDGPLPLATYMQRCLADPEFGYYTTRQAIGRRGDFITAPEISQMFGELIGVWCVGAWEALDRPDRFCLAEAGPGHGTLMADLLRVLAARPDMMRAMEVVLIELSPAMRAAQAERLEAFATAGSTVGGAIRWVDALADLPDLPTLLIANEFLDALPFRQYVKAAGGWRETGIGLNETGKLARLLLPVLADPAILPQGADREAEGSVFEHASAREAVIETVAAHLAKNTGAALFIDYGHAASGFGDTFQAVGDHRYRDPLAEPGRHDLTSHVDFERLAAAARASSIAMPRLATQGAFLLALGLLERAGALGSAKSADVQDGIRADVERLAGPAAMGDLFKVLQLTSPDLPLAGHS